VFPAGDVAAAEEQQTLEAVLVDAVPRAAAAVEVEDLLPAAEQRQVDDRVGRPGYCTPS
jgi:hypothetical protein